MTKEDEARIEQIDKEIAEMQNSKRPLLDIVDKQQRIARENQAVIDEYAEKAKPHVQARNEAQGIVQQNSAKCREINVNIGRLENQRAGILGLNTDRMMRNG